MRWVLKKNLMRMKILLLGNLGELLISKFSVTFECWRLLADNFTGSNLIHKFSRYFGYRLWSRYFSEHVIFHLYFPLVYISWIKNVLVTETSPFLKKKYSAKYIAVLLIYSVNMQVSLLKMNLYHIFSSHIWNQLFKRIIAFRNTYILYHQPKCKIVSCCIMTYIWSVLLEKVNSLFLERSPK